MRSWLISSLVERADERAVAQHDDAVGALLDLVQAVRDEDDDDAVGLQLGDHLEQLVGLGERQARGRLVHDDEARVERQRLGDLDHLLLRQRQVGDRRVRPRNRRRGACSSGVTLASQRARVDQPQRPAAQRLAADEDVGGDVEIVEQVEFLVDEGDAGAHRAGDRERRHARRRRCGSCRGRARRRRPGSSSASTCRRRSRRRGRCTSPGRRRRLTAGRAP